MEKEVDDAGWIDYPRHRPRKVPLMVISGNIVPKMDAKDGGRLVWNDSWPVPIYLTGAVNNFTWDWVPIETNDHFQLPDCTGFEWSSI